MSKHEILMTIKRHCEHCPLKCHEECRLRKLKNGIDPDPRKPPTQKQIEALMRSRRRTDKKAVEYRATLEMEG